MKKQALFFCMIVGLSLLFSACGSKKETPSPSMPPYASAEPSATPEPSEEPEPTEETAPATATPAPTSDPRNEESVVRAEIRKLLKDAQELIDEGLTDDAMMILRDLSTRTLTAAEQNELDALQRKMVTISD